MQFYDNFIVFIIKSFSFISKEKISLVLEKIDDTQYYIVMCGIGIFIIFFSGIFLGLIFKIKSWF